MQRSVGSAPKAKHYEEIIEKRFSNYRLMLYFSLLSISVLFISLSLLYLFSKAGSNGKQPALELHPLFFINSLLLGTSSIGLYFTGKYYHADDFKRFKIFLGITFITGTLFILGQLVAWYLQWEVGYSFQHSSAAYLYIISGLHGLHIIGGLVFLGIFAWKAFTELKDFPTSIIYFTDPIVRHQLGNLTLYWHFMGALWIYLMAFFLLAK
jgi:cytochrome c oxidase subunit 3